MHLLIYRSRSAVNKKPKCHLNLAGVINARDARKPCIRQKRRKILKAATGTISASPVRTAPETTRVLDWIVLTSTCMKV